MPGRMKPVVYHRHHLTAACAPSGNTGRHWTQREVEMRLALVDVEPYYCWDTVDVLTFAAVRVAERTGLPDAEVARQFRALTDLGVLAHG